MLNSLAAFAIVGLVNDVFKIQGPTFARTADVGNAAMPILFGRDGSLGIFIALAMVPIAYVLIYRTTLGFEIRTAGANPSAARYAGMSPRRLIILTMSLCGLFAGLAGTIEILSPRLLPGGLRDDDRVRRHHRRAPRASRTRSASCSPPCCSAACAPARRRCRSTADIPIEIIDVIQGLILLFLAAEVVIRRAAPDPRRNGSRRMSSSTVSSAATARSSV